jgi:hypothetical protein
MGPNIARRSLIKGAAAAGLAIPAGLTRHEATSQPDVFTLYMSPYGSKSASGLTMREAVPTLNEVQSRLKTHKPDMDVEVRILHVRDKPYTDKVVQWTYSSPTHTITFMPSDYQPGATFYDISGRPVFDGGGSPDYLFYFTSAKGQKTNLAFYYLQIQRYHRGGIALVGSREDPAGWNGYNRVYGCYFYQLGNKHTGQPGDAYGGVSTWNSRHNTIKNNHFVALENIGNTCEDDGTSPCAPLIHGVYLAHRSNNNLVTENRFQDISGDPIRLRNYSNYNQILSNKFWRTGDRALISTWNARNTECRSWQNEFRSNSSFACGYGGKSISLKSYSRNPQKPGCPAHSSQVLTSNNYASVCP